MPAELIFVRKLSILSPLLGMPSVFIVWASQLLHFLESRVIE